MSPPPPDGVLTSVTFDTLSETYRAEYEPETTPPSMAVVSLLAWVLDTSPIEMAQLQHSVDTEALDTLLTSRSARAVVEISFPFEGYEITVGNNGLAAKGPQQRKVEDIDG